MDKLNEFGQYVGHDNFSLGHGLGMLFLWPLLVIFSFWFISYTIRKLEEAGVFEEEVETATVNTETTK